MAHPDSIEIAGVISRYFEGLPEKMKGAKGDGAWTKQLKKDLVTLGQEYGWNTCPVWDGERLKWGWLYDLIWYKENTDGHVSEIYLVMESEWERKWGAIKYDFEKLLLAKSMLKLMVFQTDSGEIGELFRLLEKGIRVFSRLQSIDEIYLLIAYDNSTGKFVIRQHDGKGEPLANHASVAETAATVTASSILKRR
jgi:hypothetical protein